MPQHFTKEDLKTMRKRHAEMDKDSLVIRLTDQLIETMEGQQVSLMEAVAQEASECAKAMREARTAEREAIIKLAEGMRFNTDLPFSGNVERYVRAQEYNTALSDLIEAIRGRT